MKFRVHDKVIFKLDRELRDNWNTYCYNCGFDNKWYSDIEHLDNKETEVIAIIDLENVFCGKCRACGGPMELDDIQRVIQYVILGNFFSNSLQMEQKGFSALEQELELI